MMKNLKFVLLAIIFTAVVGFLVIEATKSSSSTVYVPSELPRVAAGKSLNRIRVGGKVSDKAINYQLEPEIVLSFEVEDLEKTTSSIPVVYRGLKPDMFAVGRNVIIDGDFINGTIKANKLLTQCPSKYEAAKGPEGGK